MRFNLCIVCLLLLSPFALLGQRVVREHSVSASWGGEIPSGKSFLSHVSWVVPQMRYEYVVIPQLSVTGSATYSYGKEPGMINEKYDGDFVTGNSIRSLSSFPLQLGLSYFPLGGKTALVQPYLAVSGGSNYAKFYITGDFINSCKTSNWSGMFSAGLGIRYYIPYSDRIFLDINGTYQYAGNKLTKIDSDAQQGFLVRIGAGFRFGLLKR